MARIMLTIPTYFTQLLENIFQSKYKFFEQHVQFTQCICDNSMYLGYKSLDFSKGHIISLLPVKIKGVQGTS